MQTTTRRAIQYPSASGSDSPQAHIHIGYVALAADVDVLYTQGTSTARATATHQASGGAFWYETDTGLLYYDDGTNWHNIGTPAAGSITNAMLAANSVDTSKIIDGTIATVDLADSSVTAAKLQTAIPVFNQAGTHAARPAANAVYTGTQYFETDTLQLFRSNGTAWVAVAPIVGAAGSWQLIADSGALAASASSIDFSSIPSTFTHLWLRTALRQTGTTGNMRLQCNGDATTGNYCTANGGVYTAGTANGALCGSPALSSDPANTFALIDIFIGYYQSNGVKMMWNNGGVWKTSTTGQGALNYSFGYLSALAINRLTLLLDSNQYAIGSRAMLYGQV